jgi:predicted solute-binding protein
MPHRLGIIPHAYAQPLFAGLRGPEGPAAPAFELVTEPSAQLALELRQGNLDGAFLSPIEYARDAARYHLVPGSGAVSEGESGTVLLLFSDRGESLDTIAVDPAYSSEIVLLHLVMAEKYDVIPKFVPAKSGPIEALATADAVLVAGDAAAGLRSWERKLDVVDEWDDALGLPYVHGLWAVRPGVLSAAELALLRVSGAAADARRSALPDDSFRYGLTPDDMAAFHEFIRIAYYHGVLKDIPDIRLLPHEGAAPFTATN